MSSYAPACGDWRPEPFDLFRDKLRIIIPVALMISLSFPLATLLSCGHLKEVTVPWINVKH